MDAVWCRSRLMKRRESKNWVSFVRKEKDSGYTFLPPSVMDTETPDCTVLTWAAVGQAVWTHCLHPIAFEGESLQPSENSDFTPHGNVEQADCR